MSIRLTAFHRNAAPSWFAPANRFEAQHQISAGYFKLKGLCCFQEAWDLMDDSHILDVAEDLIWSECYGLRLALLDQAHQDGTFVSWHQDSAYFGCEPHEMITFWLALTPANKETGCLRMMPKSHDHGYDTAKLRKIRLA